MMSARLTAAERMARLLGVIPWVVARDGAFIDEMTARFDYPRDQLLADLTEVLFFVGVHPYTPDTLIEVDIAEEVVHIRYADWFSQPLKLSAEEAARLLIAGRSVLALTPEGDSVGQEPTGGQSHSGKTGTGEPADGEAGPLLRALAKLDLVLGDEAGASVEVSLGYAPRATLDTLRRAVEDRRRVEIDYYSYHRDRLTARVVDPAFVFSDRGHWYLSGWCHRAGAERVFRVDRIRSVTLTETRVEADHSLQEPPTPAPDPDGPVVTLRLTEAAAWAAEQYPVLNRRDLGGGAVEVKLVASETWLARLLMRLGPEVEVVEMDPAISTDLVASTAARILRRYRSQP